MTGVDFGASSRRARRRILPLLGGAAILVLVVASLLAVRGGGVDEASRPGAIERVAESPSPRGASSFRLATFNILGSGHTPPGNKRGFESGIVRMGHTVRILKREGLSVVGFQEMRLDQYDEFHRLAGASWDSWPERPTRRTVYAQRHIANSIAWRTDTWTAIRKEVEPIRYITDESTVNYPVVWLQHRLTGQVVIAANFHNVSNVHDHLIEGGAEARRAEEVRKQIALANRLTAENPDVPIFFTGDFNERQSLFCKIVGNTALRAANGGWATPDSCQPPPVGATQIDWVFGSAPATLGNWRRLRDDLVQKTTDHPVITSDVTIPPRAAVTQPITHVVLLSLEGVRPREIARLGASTPGFHRLRAEGASTLNARTVERTLSLSNVTSMLTGRPVSTSLGGHGVVDGTTASTVHRTAGRYVPGVFDVVHDHGLSTAVLTSDPGAAILDRSWNYSNGAPDTTWIYSGRDKITSYTYRSRPGLLTRQLHQQLSGTPATLTYAQLSTAESAGHTYGFWSDQYKAAVVRVSKQVDAVMNAIDTNPTLRGRTLLLVAGEHGGEGRNHTRAGRLANVRVPLFARGPGVPAGADLYSLNPDYARPGTRITSYSGSQPIRTAYVANLITATLGLPAVPGSTLNRYQNFTAFGRP